MTKLCKLVKDLLKLQLFVTFATDIHIKNWDRPLDVYFEAWKCLNALRMVIHWSV